MKLCISSSFGPKIYQYFLMPGPYTHFSLESITHHPPISPLIKTCTLPIHTPHVPFIPTPKYVYIEMLNWTYFSITREKQVTHSNTNPAVCSTLRMRTAISPWQWQPWTAVSSLLGHILSYIHIFFVGIEVSFLRFKKN